MDLTKLLEALEKNSFPSVFQLLEVAHIPWLMNPFHLQSQQLHHSLSSVVTSPSLTLILLPLFSTNKDPVIILGHPDKLPSSGQLISSLTSICTNSPLYVMQHNHSSSDWSMDIFGEPKILHAA